LMDDSQTGVPNLDMGMFVHEISEQWYKQTILGLPQITEEPPFGQVDVAFNESHYYACIKESLVTGMLRTSTQTSGFDPNLIFQFYDTNGNFKTRLLLNRDYKVLDSYKTALKHEEAAKNLERQKKEMISRRPNFSGADY
jgi:hypothetical protein